MRIVFDVTTCAKARRGGIPSYGWNLVQACARVAPEHSYVLGVRPNRWFKRGLLAGMLPGAPPRLLLDHGHRWTLGEPIDVLHGIGVRLPGGGRFPKTVMVHDLNVFEFPELSTESWRRKRQRRIRQTVGRADRLLSYSQHGAEALTRLLGVPPERVRVVPLGVDTQRFHRPPEDDLQRVLETHGIAQRPYVLMLGEPSERKNQTGLIDAFVAARLPNEWRLVLGGPRDAARERLADRARRLGLADDRLALPGWVPDTELPALLAGAALYVCASLHEGFGLPVLEAQACGAPVLSSNRAALPETLGDCGRTFDPGQPDDFARALGEMATDESLRAELRVAGPERVARQFSWEQVARRTLDVFEQLSGEV